MDRPHRGTSFARAVRADKVCLAGIAATLRHYARNEAEREIPVWKMIATPVSSLEARAASIAQRLNGAGVSASWLPTEATVGGGALPGQTLPSVGVSIDATGDVDEGATRLRTGRPGVIPRVQDGRLIVDLRTVVPEDDDLLVGAIRSAIAGLA